MELLSRLVSRLSSWREQRRILKSFKQQDFEESDIPTDLHLEEALRQIDKEIREARHLRQAWQPTVSQRPATAEEIDALLGSFQVRSQLGRGFRPSPFPEGTDARGRYIKARIQELEVELAELQQEWSSNYVEKQEPPISLHPKSAMKEGERRTVPKKVVPVVLIKDADGKPWAAVFKAAPTEFPKMMYTEPVQP